MIGVYFTGSNMTVDQYNAINERLMAASGGEPTGLMLHTCFKEGEALAMFDVWESQEAFEALGPVLMPIVAELGAELSPPQFVEMVDYLVV